MIEIGKLYRCPKYYCLVYPTIKDAFAVKDDFGGSIRQTSHKYPHWYNPVSIGVDNKLSYAENEKTASQAANFRSDHGIKVFFTNPKHVYLVVAHKIVQNENFIGIIFENRIGWIIFKDWLKNSFEIA